MNGNSNKGESMTNKEDKMLLSSVYKDTTTMTCVERDNMQKTGYYYDVEFEQWLESPYRKERE